MSDYSFEDSRSQLKAIANNKNDAMFLFESLANLSVSLVMGQEQYLRRFDTPQALPLLVSVVEKYSESSEGGDIMVMGFRSLSLILEHVPSSYDGAQEFHKPLMKLAFRAIHKALCVEWLYVQTDADSLYEECLRTVRFIGKDDRTGAILQHVFVGDLLTICASENSIMARQALECLLMLCTKVVMPSELEKPQQLSGFLSLFRPKKKASKAHGRAITVDESDNPLVINVENVIAPFLHTLIEQYTETLPHVQEVWALLECTIQCLGTLMERALLCHRPHTAHLLVTRDLPQLLFRVITVVEDNTTIEVNVRNERILFVESVLATITSCHSGALAESLLKKEAKKFFHSILEDSSSEITTLLDQPFPLGVMAARSTQRRDKDHITSIAAVRLLILATPNVPPEAFGLKPKVVLPVHQWMWEDELRHANRLVEEQCVTLETSWTRLCKDSAVVVHTKSLPADLLSMTMARGFSGGFRNISRSFTPFVYHFVDESSVRPIVKVKEAGPDPVNTPVFSATASSAHKGGGGSSSKHGRGSSSQKASLSTTDRLVLMNESVRVPVEHLAIAEEYFIALCDYATYASGQMAKQLATCACASILQMMFLTNADARVEKLMTKAMLPMCDMFRTTLNSGDKATKAVVLTMTEWLLRHSMAADWCFCDMAQRCGYVSLLDEMSRITPAVAVTKDAKPTRTADLADRSGDLVREITARLQKQRGASGGSDGHALTPKDTKRLINATEALRKAAKEPGRHEKILKEFFDAIVHSKSVTAYEVYQMKLASAALSYVLNGTTAHELLGNPFVFSSGASGSTFSRSVVPSVDLGSLADPDMQGPSPAGAMVAGGMRISDVLQLHASPQRAQCLAKLVASAPSGLQQLVDHLVGTLTLQSTFPLVESIITHERVACKTPLQAFQGLSDISPRVVLCGKAGEVASPTFVNSSTVPEFNVTQEPSTIFTESTPARAAKSDADGTSRGANDTASTTGIQPPQPQPQTIPSATSVTAPLPSQARDFCLRGHRLKEVPHYVVSCVCDFCACCMKSGYACRICNFDVCKKCHATYKGNATLLRMMQTPQSIPRNRANLVACIGDIERYFRTGSTSTKGTQVAPTSQSSLSHLDRFATRAELFLRRKVSDGGVAAPVAEVARLLLQHPALLRRILYQVLQEFFTRGVLPGNPDANPADNEVGSPLSGQASGKPTSTPPALSPEQRKIAEELANEAIEDRYILYRPTVGRCSFQETFLSMVYQQAFAVGNKQVLFQLENCLMRQEGSSEPLNPQLSVLPTPLSSAKNRTEGGSVANNSSISKQADDNPPSGVGDEFAGNKITPEQRFLFHHFDTDTATHCSCGQHSREDFATKGVSDMTLELPDFARRPDILLLVFLHRTFYSPSHAVTDAGIDRSKLDVSVFVNSAVTTAVVKALEASALRVAVLPVKFALPRWTAFVLEEARFLVPARARERIARYLAYSARRSFITYMRLFRQFRLDRTVAIAPGEWARMSNHKFTINRARFLEDAFKVLRKAADARIPISIEFVGDVGIGQGPTAQFYTLLAQEVSRVYLELWRNVTLASNGTTTAVTTGAVKAPSFSASSASSANRRTAGNGAATHNVLSLSQHPSTIDQQGVRSSASSGTRTALVNPPPEGFYPSRSKRDDNAQLKALRTGVPSTPKKNGPPSSPPSSATRGSLTAAPAFPPSSAGPSATRRLRANGQIILANPRPVLQDYVQTQRERAMAFYAVGAALGRAFLDEQVFPLPLSAALAIFLRSGVPFAKILLNAAAGADKEAETPVDLLELPMRAVRLVDPSVAHSLESLAKLDDASLKALELPFTLPGDDEFELIPGGTNVFVTASNVKRYQRRVLNALLYDSVAFPLRMITMGCHDVVPREALGVLEIDELMNLLCGEDKSANEPLWSADEIRSILVGDHGYQNDSPQLEMLGNILAKKLDAREQRAFLLFCTGCPRLPVGGVRALGAITVVKRSNAFAHARGMAAAEERRIRGDGDEDEDDAEDELNPLDGGAGATTTASNMDATSSYTGGGGGNPDGLVVRTNSSISRQGGGGGTATEAASLDFEFPDSEWALPSVNTCFKYLKLPPYPTEDLMYRKLLVSITQCGDTFELS